MLPAGFTTRPEIIGTFGVASASHWLAASTAMSILERGGNAFDAAVAGGFVLQVAEPHMNGMGGDSVTLIGPAGGPARVLCGQGVAPARATIAHYRGFGLDLVPGAGLLAAVVPGAFDAWLLMLRDYGTMDLATVMAPAIGYARAGCPLIAGVTQAIAGVEAMFRDEWQSSAAVYLPGGKVPATGTLFHNPELADTYQRIVAEAIAAGGNREHQIEAARRTFRDGFIAEAIDAFVARAEAMDSSGRRNKGVLSGADMAAWQATWEEPVAYDYHGYQVVQAGPWSQGPALLQVLALLKGFDLASLDPVGPDFVHILLEATKLAYADREAWYGDPAFVDVPMGTLLSDAYTDARRRLIGDASCLELRPGSPDGRAPKLPTIGLGAVRVAGTGEPGRVEREGAQGHSAAVAARAMRGPSEGDTCHLDVIDRFGNMVAATPSGGWLQSSPVIPGLGFCLGTRAQMYWLEDGLPASLAPGRRPRTTLNPVLAMKDGEPCLGTGSPGGDCQGQWALQFLLRHIEHGLDLQAAIDQPMLQSDHWRNSFYPRDAAPNRVIMESRFPPETVAELTRRGHQIELSDDWSLGRNCAARRDGGVFRAAATPRRQQAYAVGR